MPYVLTITYTNGQRSEYPIDEIAHAGILRSLSADQMPEFITMGSGCKRLTIVVRSVATIAISKASE